MDGDPDAKLYTWVMLVALAVALYAIWLLVHG